MSAHTQQIAAAFTGPGPVQAVMAPARAVVTMLGETIVGEPEKLQAAAPRFDEIGRGVVEVAEQAQAAADGIATWDGAARDAFDGKVSEVVQQIQQLEPMLQEMRTVVEQAAQTAIEAASAIAETVRAIVQAVIQAFEEAKAKAAESLGAALAAWLQWAVAQAGKLIQLVQQIAQQVGALLQQAAAMIQRITQIAQRVGQLLRQLYDRLGVEEKVKDLAKTALDGIQAAGAKLWEGAKWAGGEVADRFDPKGKIEDKIRPDRWGEKHFGDHDGSSSGKPKTDIKFNLLEGKDHVGPHAGASGEGSLTQADGTTASGKAEAEAGTLMREGKVFAGNKGIGAEGSLFSGARASAEGEISRYNGAVAVKADGAVSAGAELEGKASVGHTGAEAKAGGFAGAKAEGSYGLEVAGVGGAVTGEAWAGAGFEADAKATWDDGKLTVGAGVGAGAGVGGKVGAEVSLDVGQTMQTVKDAGSAVVNYFKEQ